MTSDSSPCARPNATVSNEPVMSPQDSNRVLGEIFMVLLSHEDRNRPLEDDKPTPRRATKQRAPCYATPTHCCQVRAVRWGLSVRAVRWGLSVRAVRAA